MKMIENNEIQRVFFELEKDPQLFKYKIRGFSLYFILRFPLEMTYRNAVAIRRDNKNISITKGIILRLKNKLMHFFLNHNCNIIIPETTPSPFLFISTSDWTINEGESIELNDIIKYYKSKGEVINFVQPNISNKVKKQDYIDSFHSLCVKCKTTLTSSEKFIIFRFIQFLTSKSENFHVENRIIFENYISYVFSMAAQLSKIIINTKAKHVFARSIYSEPWVLLACNKCKVNCIEVQHGVVLPNNIYYRKYSNMNAVDKPDLIFPNYILTLGERWNSTFTYQNELYSNANVMTIGQKALPQKKKKEQNVFRVLICLQSGIFNIDTLIVPFVEKFLNDLIQHSISLVIRPHPNSIESSINLYEKHLGNNLEIENPSIVPFYESLALTDAIVSHSSMCLYEALATNIPAISVLDARGLVLDDNISFVGNPLDLFNEILNIKKKEQVNVMIPYLSPFNEKVLEQFYQY